MNLEDVRRLKEAAAAAQTAADEAKKAAAAAKADADAHPGDAAKGVAAEAAAVAANEANLKAAEAWKVWNGAERNVPAVAPSDWRVILLGLYLIVILLGGVYFLVMLAMAVPPEKATGALRTRCCPEGANCPTPTPGTSPSPGANVNTAVNSNVPARVPVATGASPANPANANAGVPAATATIAPVRPATTAVATPNGTAGPGGAEAQEILIPAFVCIEYVGRTSADGYLFLTVLFAGMVGAATRLVFSFVRHQGIRDFSLSWVWFYLFTPFSGATISLFLYYVIRGGFYGSAVGKPLALNIFAFFALGTLSGLFAENAMQKLRDVAEVLLAKVPEKSKNPKNPNGD